MFVDRMDNYIQLQEALGNTLFRDNDTVKVMTFLNNVTTVLVLPYSFIIAV